MERNVLMTASVNANARQGRWLLSVAVFATFAGCGTGAGDSAVCQEPPPTCEGALVSAVNMFSRDSCNAAIDNYWCGVNAQALAECLHLAQVCLESGATRETIAGVLAASACAAEFAEWDDCFGNGDVEGGGGGYDD